MTETYLVNNLKKGFGIISVILIFTGMFSLIYFLETDLAVEKEEILETGCTDLKYEIMNENYLPKNMEFAEHRYEWMCEK